MRMIDHWIDGVPSTAGHAHGEVLDPSTGAVAAHVRVAGAGEVDAAVAAAATAYRSWRETSLTRRTQILFRYRELLDRNRDRLAEMVSREHGKVLADARGEVARGIEVVEFACGIAQLLKGERSDQVSTGFDAYSLRQPLGVVAGITPFNFPVMVPMWMFPIAIACGNAFVLKPSEKDPSASVALAELFAEAGLPAGVFNVVHGRREAVERLLTHPDVRAVSFVGSTPVAQHVYATASAAGKRVQALGGAKNHMVVLPDADLEAAADAAVSAAYGSAGERCMAISVVVAVGDVGDKLIAAIRDRLGKLTVGPSLDQSSEMGPLVTGEHRDRVTGYVEAGVREGAQLVVDGRDLVDRPGFFLGPCLFDHVSPGMSIYADEIFGPVLSVVRAATYDDAIELVNANPYANGVAIFTNDGGAARTFERAVDAGMVGINVPIPVPMAFYSFGGAKQSLLGDLHVHGPDGVRFYTRGKAVTARWPDPHERGVDLGFPTNR
jgi:malonate-semialdehyde dehydrogenase (acetylating) / methylmalonate-semialdehyde dehydrogenase